MTRAQPYSLKKNMHSGNWHHAAVQETRRAEPERTSFTRTDEREDEHQDQQRGHPLLYLSSSYPTCVLIVKCLQYVCPLVPSACVTGTKGKCEHWSKGRFEEQARHPPEIFLNAWVYLWAAAGLDVFLRTILAIFCYDFFKADFIHCFCCLDQLLTFWQRIKKCSPGTMVSMTDHITLLWRYCVQLWW